MKIEITKEMVEKSKSYLPLAYKIALSQKIAEACIEKVEITSDETVLPPRYIENSMTKTRYLMSVMAYLYLSAKTPDDDILMPLDIYDKWGESHIFGQLERHKRNAEICDKVFDLLADYRTTEKMINTEIYTRLQIQNDPCARLLDMVLSQTSPDMLKSGIAQFEEIQQSIEKGDANAEQPVLPV